MKYIKSSEDNFMSSGLLDIGDNNRLLVQYINGIISFQVSRSFLLSKIYYDDAYDYYLYPVTTLEVDFDNAKKNIKRIESLMFSVVNNEMSLKDFLNEVPQFRLYINEYGTLSSF